MSKADETMETLSGTERKQERTQDDSQKELVPVLDFRSLDLVAPRIMYRIINERCWRELQEMPHICFLDLAVVFYVQLEKERGGMTAVRVTNELARLWKITPEGLWKLARANMLREHPPVIKDILEVIKEGLQGDEALQDGWEEIEDDQKMYVLTNECGIWGASCVLYPHTLERFAASLGKDLVVIPSSIHETLLLVLTPYMDVQDLELMIRTVNLEDVLPEDRLSNRAYGYSRKQQRFMFLSEMLSPDTEIAEAGQSVFGVC